jgi:hypothetical protein
MVVKCKLCLVNDADKKGSHIVPHFLLKRIENVDGKKGRDQELAFVVKGSKVSSHFGRSVSTDKLDKIFGPISDTEIKMNQNPSIVDYFFCSDCEKKFSVIESEYAKTLTKKSSSDYESGVSTDLGILFWASVIWRISINYKNGVKFTDSENERLRGFLDEFQKLKFSDIDFNKLKSDEFAGSISYRLLRSSNTQGDAEKGLFIHPEITEPYCLLLGEFVLAFSFANNYEHLKTKEFLNLSHKIMNSHINKLGESEIVCSINEDEIVEMYKQYALLMLKSFRRDLSPRLDNIYREMTGRAIFMPMSLKDKIFAELAYENAKLGRKYNNDCLVRALKKVLHFGVS